MRRELLSLLGVAAVSTAAQAADERPNIIIFMTDDMGYSDVGFTGCKDINTPHLDKLAESGVVFTQGYVTHGFSAPSRAGLMSGRYPHRFGFETNPAYDPSNPYLGISESEVLFPARLQKSGYKTGAIGKWHLGASEVHHPCNRGFDYFYGFLGGGHDYFRIDNTKKVDEAYKQGLIRNNKPATFEGYLTDALSADAVDFVNKNKNNPFFLYVAYNAPHQPLQAPKEDIARYAHIKDTKRCTYAAMVDIVDRGVGQVVEALKKNGDYENTLIFFLSDNGGPQPSESSPNSGNASVNFPLRGGKGSFYDGGIHVPFMACWPAKIKGGVRYDYPVISLDISRTAVALAGADADSAPAMEGINLIPYITGENKAAPHDYLFWRAGNGSAWAVVAADRTKHVQTSKSKEPEMFYLPKDISETNDIVAKNQKRATEMRSQWESWNKSNINCNMLGYKDYHKKRDEFFKAARPQVKE
ncbi:MAG: sulfatase-like hydrolase/transferase [Rikenellaceae bacterium]